VVEVKRVLEPGGTTELNLTGKGELEVLVLEKEKKGRYEKHEKTMPRPEKGTQVPRKRRALAIFGDEEGGSGGARLEDRNCHGEVKGPEGKRTE